MPGDPQMTDWQERMVEEARQLGEKLLAATAMLTNQKYLGLTELERRLLHNQITQMEGYYYILVERIAHYTGDTK
jgi:hypothetical protein